MMSPSYELARCVVCGGAETHELADREAVREEMESLWSFHTRRLQPDTPPQRLADRVAFSQDPPWGVVQCIECGLVYRNPRERADDLTRAYEGESLAQSVLDGLFETQRASYRAQAERLTRVAGKTGAGLEIGSYVGGFLAAASAQGWRFEGVDVNSTVSEFVRGRGYRVTIGDISAVPKDARFRAIAIWNCFDQLADPRATLAEARTRMVSGGTLAIRVPNGGFYAALRPLLDGAPPVAGAVRGLLAHNNLLGFPYRHGFTQRALTRLLHAEGFDVVHTFGDALVRIADEHTHRWAAMEERLVKMTLRFVVRRQVHLAPWMEVYARPA